MILAKYRPQNLDLFVTDKSEKLNLLQSILDKPKSNVYLLVGSSGSGKTTFARIFANKWCGGTEDNFDYLEVNASAQETRGIGAISEWESFVSTPSMSGGKKILVIDEAHQLTKPAQNALLKVLEEPTLSPDTYVFLCSTAPDSIIKTIHTRCLVIDFSIQNIRSAFFGERLKNLTQNILGGEGHDKTEEDYLNIIVHYLENTLTFSVREFVNYIGNLDKGPFQPLEIDTLKNEIIEVPRSILEHITRGSRGYSNFTHIVGLINDLLNENKTTPESIKMVSLGYFNSIVSKGGDNQTIAGCVLAMRYLCDDFSGHDGKFRLISSLGLLFKIIENERVN